MRLLLVCWHVVLLVPLLPVMAWEIVRGKEEAEDLDRRRRAAEEKPRED